MKILDNISTIPTNVLEKIINQYKEEFLTSPNNEYVVFDGTAKVIFEGGIEECTAFIEIAGERYLVIYSKEAYNKMIEKISR